MATIPRVIIVGGGLAGLAAAVRLAEAGYEVEVLEKRSALGGRASSFIPPGEAEPIDNCQHVLLGCCTNLLDFFRRTGTAHLFRFYNSFLFLGPRGISTVSASALPAPLHLLPSLVRFRELEWRDRWAVARAMSAILWSPQPPPDQPLLDWFERQRQTPAAIEKFWRVILTSALNEDLERLSTRHVFQVFLDAFLRNRRGYRMGVPATPLRELYSSKILKERCAVRLGTPVTRLELSGDCVSGLYLLSGEQRSADFLILTIPPDALLRVLPETLDSQWPEMAALAKLEWSPITGIHLWLDRPITDLEHTAVLGRTVQWVFNRSAIGRRGNAASQFSKFPESSESSKSSDSSKSFDPQYLQLVVSASRALMGLRKEEIVDLSLRELRELFPASRDAKLLRAVVVKESKATLSPQPGWEATRPGPQTPFRNLFLAGDWTATGWPPTMEGAVRSGYRAAELVTEAAGRPQQFLQPDLPADPLVRLLERFRGRQRAKGDGLHFRANG